MIAKPMRTQLLTLSIFVALTQSAFTCAPALEEPTKTCPGGAAPTTSTIELGRLGTMGNFEPLTAEQVYVPEFGSQGGQHIYVSLRFYAPEGESEWAHRVTITDDGGDEFGFRNTLQDTCAPGWTIVENIQVFLGITSTSTGTIEVESGPVDDFGDLTRVTKASGTIQIQWP